jgi:hypothetical protein
MHGKAIAALAVLLLAGCATAPREPARFGPRQLGDARISGLPSVATFAWAAPRSAFAGLDAERDDALHPLTADLRLSAATVLRANGWRQAPPDSAQFLLSMVRVERTEEVVVMVPDPRNDRQQPRRCDTTRSPTAGQGSGSGRNRPGQPTTEPPCTNHPVPQYPPIRSAQLVTRRSVGYAIRRVADGASRQWVLDDLRGQEMENQIARLTLDLLLADAK